MERTEKLFWPIEKLREWDKNPRSITKEGFERLKYQIKKLGQYKPLIITPDGIVLGGNMRVRAYRELGIEQAWVSIVEPKNEDEMLEYALSDNDRAGYYDSDMLANLLPGFDIDLGSFAVDLRPPITLDKLGDGAIPLPDDEQQEPEAFDGFVCVLKIKKETFPLVKERLENLCHEHGIEINIS